MNENYKKILWIYEIPEALEGKIVSVKRLDRLTKDAQKDLVFNVLYSLDRHFSQMSDHDIQALESDLNYRSQFAEKLDYILTIWLSGVSSG